MMLGLVKTLWPFILILVLFKIILPYYKGEGRGGGGR